jgi:hypothetical protein
MRPGRSAKESILRVVGSRAKWPVSETACLALNFPSESADNGRNGHETSAVPWASSFKSIGYQDSTDCSAELLHLVLRSISAQEAAFNPLGYAFRCELVSASILKCGRPATPLSIKLTSTLSAGATSR